MTLLRLAFLCAYMVLVAVFAARTNPVWGQFHRPLRDTGAVFVQLAVPGSAMCKRRGWEVIRFPYNTRGAGDAMPAKFARRTPAIVFHGNISYSFDYRSQLDTPFSGNNIQQHNEQVYADAVLKGKYPFRVILDARQSNSPFFKSYTDVNVQFNHPQYQQMEKQRLIGEYNRKLDSIYDPGKYERMWQQEAGSLATTKNWMNDPVRKQEILQERESLTDSLMKLPDTTKMNDQLHQPTATEQKIKAAQHLIDSLQKLMDSTRHIEDSASKALHTALTAFSGKTDSAGSTSELAALQKEAGLPEMSKTDKTLMSVKQFGIGRSALNYSDLTVSGISLNGVNIEYNPSYYAAFAAGTVDYLFRDFVLQPTHFPPQKLVVGRFGWGDPKKRAWIFTVYNGTKNNIGGSVTDTASTAPVTQTIRVFGYSLEVLYRLAKNLDMTAEWAKSSTPGSYQAGGHQGNRAFAFSDRSNEAWSVKMNLGLPAWDASVSAFYRLIGANFQSYSLFSTGSQQQQWGIQWKQYFFRKQLSLTAQVKKEGFEDPLLAQSYSSSTLLESIQAVYRRKKWPVFSLGYMPSTQLSKASDGSISETMYYTLTGSVVYSYRVKRVNMSTMLMYSRFYNRGTDSGFIAYDAKNLMLSHTMGWGIWSLQTQVQYTNQPLLLYWTVEESLNVRIGRCLTLGAGWSDYLLPVTHTSYQGGLLQGTVQMSKWGNLRVQYNKAYIPDALGGLSASNWGKATWYKIF